MSWDSFVVGWDRTSQQAVYIDEESVDRWRAKGHRRWGDESLVCLFCFEGDEAPVGTLVPLIVRHRVGGVRRAHFAHPAGLGPPHGHGRETLWHSTSKFIFASWAKKQADVVAVAIERPTPDRARRADVEVVFADGSRVALEMQYDRLHDEEWRRRDADYADAGIVAVWIWECGVRIPWVVAKAGQPLWFFDLEKNKIGTLVGLPHGRPLQWHQASDLTRYGRHVPPCVNDKTDYRLWDLDALSLTPQGLTMPADLADQLAADRRRVRKDADAAHAESEAAAAAAAVKATKPVPARPVETHPLHAEMPKSGPHPSTPMEAEPALFAMPAGHPAPAEPANRAPATRLPTRFCDLCGIRLDEFVYRDATRHITCEQDRLEALARRRRP